MQIPREQLLAFAAQLERRYNELEQEAAESATRAHTDPKAYGRLSKDMADLQEVAQAYRTYRRLVQEGSEADDLIRSHGDADMKQMAQQEAAHLRSQAEDCLAVIDRYWQAKHAEPDRPLIVEIRAGTGGLEASLFVADLARMYQKYASRWNLDVETMQGQASEAGGLKEITLAVKGVGAWPRFKFESGVHRVQRVPATEAQGRIHTSTVTVAVLPEPEEIELPPIPNKDLQIDVYRASGPGGQGVNTTDSAVRIRHLPTGIMVTCQDERSQLRNKDKAMRVLRARVLDQIQSTQQEQIASDRRKQVGTGERSEKIRTYNFPDRRITDHRIGMTLHQLEAVMEGELHPIVEALATAERDKKLSAEGGAASG